MKANSEKERKAVEEYKKGRGYYIRRRIDGKDVTSDFGPDWNLWQNIIDL